MKDLTPALAEAAKYLDTVTELEARYRAGSVHVSVPQGLLDSERPLDDLVAECLPASNAALVAAAKGLFFSLPVAFDPAESIGPFLATADRAPDGEPYRFLDMGALIATQGFGENDPRPGARHRREPALHRGTLRALRIPNGALAAPQGGARPHRAGGYAAALRGQHRRRGGGERDQGRAPAPRPHRGREGWRLHHLLRGGLPWPHPRQPGGDAAQEGTPRVPHLRLAARFLPGRRAALTTRDGAARGEEHAAALGAVRLGTAAGCRQEQGRFPARTGSHRRIPRCPPAATSRASCAASAQPCLPTSSLVPSASPACWWSRSRARAACA